MPTTILLVDDHPVFRKGLLFLLEEEDDMTVVGEAGDGQAAIDRVRELSPDVVIMDITMPNLDGIEATRHILSEFSDTKVIALSIHSGKRFVEDMLHAGAVGYLLKESVPEELIQAIRTAMQGEMYLSTAITSVVVTAYKEATDPTDKKETHTLPILRTRLYRPPITDEIVLRSHLINRLEKNRNRTFTLVSAPAGYGKSILISSWLEEVKCLHTWLSLDKEHNDLRVFLAYVVAAVNSIFPEKLETLKTYLQSAELPRVSVISQSLISDLDQIDDEFILVLDDFHLINNQQVFELTDTLVQRPPLNMRLAILTRRDPSLDLSELRAYNRMNEIRMAELAFTREDVTLLFSKLHGIGLSDTLCEQLLEKTEGWIVGLRLVLLGIRDQKDAAHILASMKGSSHLVSEFLVEQVLKNQPDEIQDYLLKTSILDRFCSELAEALKNADLENDERRIDGRQFIEWLIKTNLFVIPLDEEYKWFRYHHLFQQLLQDQLKRKYQPDDIATVHSQAGEWFAENGYLDEAIKYAIAADNMEGAAELVEQNRQDMLNHDRWFIFESWLAMFPETVIQKRPGLLMARVWVLYHHFDIPAIPSVIDAVETLLGKDPREQPLHGEIDFFRGYIYYFQNDGSRSLKHLNAALKKVPETHHEIRGQIEILHGLATQMAGQKDKALGTLNELLLGQRVSQNIRQTRLLITVVYIHIIAGDLSEASGVNQQLQDVTTKNNYSYVETWSIYLKGLIHFYRNELDEAIHHFNQAMEKRYISHARAVVDCMAGLAYAYQLKGQPDQAGVTLQLLDDYVAQLDDPAYSTIARLCHARISIMKGDPIAASRLRGSPPPVENMIWWLEIPSVTHCRALLFEGSEDSLKKAVIKLQELLKLNEQNHNTCHKIPILLLLTLAYNKQKRTDEALETLKEAVDLATPGRWIFPFVELGVPMAALLKQLPKKNAADGFVQELLTAFSPLPVPPSPRPQVSQSPRLPLSPSALSPRPLVSQSPRPPLSSPLIEPLTNRELDILELLEKRLQNKEIAEKLFVSPETVKAHLKNIFQKLDSGNRREAVTKARSLNIL